MSQTLVDKLARERVQGAIDHGLKKPRPGDYTIVRKLQRDLVKEQDENDDGNRADKAKKWANTEVDYGPDLDIQRLFATADLYQEMSEADDEVSAERFDIYKVETDVVDSLSRIKIEHYFSTTVVYHINVAAHLEGRGVLSTRHDAVARDLMDNTPQFAAYIEDHGAQELLDQWLPGMPTDAGYELTWEVTSVRYLSYGRVDVTMKVSERWLTDAK